MSKAEAFQIKRLRPALREKVRYSPQSSGPSTLKISDYLDEGEVIATSVYHAWLEMREQGKEFEVGDVLVSATYGVQVCKYAGFEEAAWAELPTVPGPVATSGAEAPQN